MNKPLQLFLTITFLCVCSYSEAAFVIRNGKIMDADELATMSVDEHYGIGMIALEEKDWEEAAKQFRIVTINFPTSPYALEAYYYLGAAFYQLREFDAANEALSQYLKVQTNPKYFQKAIEYKFAVAEQFRKGAKRRLFGSKKMPRWASAKHVGLAIYDEIIAAMPAHELAAKSLYSKGFLLWEMKDYRPAVEAFQMLIRRFPKHELVPESYLAINTLYLEQSQTEFQNPDILALAQINLKKFVQDFPGEERLEVAEQNVLKIKEIYAKGLYETGQFYERIKKPKASVLYYHNAIQQFPETSIAEMCQQRLNTLERHEKQLQAAG